jgi:hypothetical protein
MTTVNLYGISAVTNNIPVKYLSVLLVHLSALLVNSATACQHDPRGVKYFPELSHYREPI